METQPPQKKKTFSSAIKWTLGIIGIFLLILFCIFLYKGYKVYKTVSPYLCSEKMILPKLEYTDNDATTMEEKYELLTQPDEVLGKTLVFTQAEFNLMLRDKLDLAKLMRAKFEDDRLLLTYAIPFPISKKYFNGTAIMHPLFEDNQFRFQIENITTNNITIEKSVTDAIENALQNFFAESKNKENFERISDIYIKDGTLYIKFKQATGCGGK